MNILKEKTTHQSKYINKRLETFITCTIPDKILQNIDKISTPIVKNILVNKFNNGADMNAVVCLFDNLFLSTANSKKHGLYHLSVNVSKWLKKLKKIEDESTSGFVFFSDILSNIESIIKIPRYPSDYDEMIREYFIGVTEINKLRYILPNFVYTFGAFICPIEKGICKVYKDSSKVPFIVFEKIPGNNMQKMLQENKLSFSQYLGMFVQILLALEVAQRNICFCHFDFHTANLMCRTIRTECKYKVPLDNNVYEVTANEYLPVIIDFGLSTVKHDDHIIGSYTFPEHGMMEYMLPGVDMYKFLTYSCIYAQGDTQRRIINLMSFYGKDDPYKFLIGGDDALEYATDEYIRKGSFSRVTTYTPIEFLDWLLNNPEYSEIVSNYIKKSERDVYIPLNFSTTVQEYDNIFQQPKKGREKAVKLVNKCIEHKASYIMSSYCLYVLNGYNNKLTSDKLLINTKNIEQLIRNSLEKMIEIDMRILDGYMNIEITNIIKIKDDSKRILNIRINSKKLIDNKTHILKLIERYFKNTILFKELLPYLQFVYTIREVKLTNVYKNFLTSFLSSPQYKTYDQNYILVNKTYRWCNVLLDSMN